MTGRLVGAQPLPGSSRERFVHFLDQPVAGERLLQEYSILVQPAEGGHGIVGIAGHEHDLQVRAPLGTKGKATTTTESNSPSSRRNSTGVSVPSGAAATRWPSSDRASPWPSRCRALRQSRRS